MFDAYRPERLVYVPPFKFFKTELITVLSVMRVDLQRKKTEVRFLVVVIYLGIENFDDYAEMPRRRAVFLILTNRRTSICTDL